MHLPFVLALLLCGSVVAKADGFPPVPDASVTAPERFEVAVKGVTGAHIDLRAAVVVGRHCRVRAATAEGAPVLVDILLDNGDDGKMLLALRVTEPSANGPARGVSFSDRLAPGESTITGPGWNSLFELRLTKDANRRE